MLASACGPVPRPFQPSSKANTNPLIDQGVPPDVAVNPLRGTSIPMAKLVTQSVVDEIIRYDIVSYPNDHGASRFVLDGEVIDAPVSASGQPFRQIRWVLTTREGIATGMHVVPVSGTDFEWDFGSPKIIREIGESTAEAVARLVLGRTATLKEDRNARAGIWIKPISDAPGDGNYSLTRSIAFALSDSGMKVTKSPDRAEHLLKARVQVDSPESGLQKVEIIWMVTDTDDKEIGRARQRNSVPTGTFDGRWGQSAVMISMAAVGAIRNILANRGKQALTQGKQPLRLTFPGGKKDGDLVIPPPTLILN